MKKLNGMKSRILFFIGTGIFMFTGCEKKENNSTEYAELTKALAKAWEVVNDNMPGTELYEISGDKINTDGTAAEGWSFYFNKTDETDGYCVRVYPDGEVFDYDLGWDAMLAISDYTSADAAEWVRVADESAPWIDHDQTYRELQVRSEDSDINFYPQTTDYVILFYKPDDGGEPVTYVEIEAYDYEVLFVEPNP